MRILRTLFVVTAVSAIASATSQEREADVAARCDLMALRLPPAWSVNIQDAVITGLTRANACLAQRDADCGEAALASIAAPVRNDDERALIAVRRAELASIRGQAEAAARIYEEAIALPAVDASLRRDLAQRRAASLLGQGEFAEALRLLAATFSCDTWTADALTQRAMAYESLHLTALAVESLAGAIRLYELAGRPSAVHQARHDALVADQDPTLVPGGDVPFLRVNPKYPDAAFRDGREGWVQFEFAVSDLGVVEQVRTVASSDKVFEGPALAAFERWRYVPKIENDLPVRRDDGRAMLRFCLSNRCSRGARRER